MNALACSNKFEAKSQDQLSTACEKYDALAVKHAIIPKAHTPKLAGKRHAEKHTFKRCLTPKSHEGAAQVNCNKAQSMQLAQLLTQRIKTEQTSLLKSLKEFADSDVMLTMDDTETMRDTTKMWHATRPRCTSSNVTCKQRQAVIFC